MQNFEHIEALWAGHRVEVRITADEMLKQAKKDVSALRFRSTTNLVGMLLSLFGVGAMWYFVHFNSYLTHLGISLIVLSIAVYTFILYLNHRTISQTNFTQHPALFLQKLKVYQLERQRLNNNLYWCYAIALSLGLGLYFVEVLSSVTWIIQIMVILLSFGWIIFSSFILRKSIIAKDKARIAQLINQFEKISAQFTRIE